MAEPLFVPSKSRYELEIAKRGSVEKARAAFQSDHIWKRISESHDDQKRNLEKLLRAFPDAAFVDRSELTDETVGSHDAIVSLGGDNHFTYCSQILLEYLRTHPSERQQVLGVVLDPAKSHGGLLSIDVPGLIDVRPRLLRGNYAVEHWTTLEARLAGETTQPFLAIGDYFIGEKNRLYTSRNIVTLHGKEVLAEKSSGVMVVTGAGAGPGSWYNNIHRVMFQEGDDFGRETSYVRVISTEHHSRSKLTLLPGETLVIESYNDDHGILVPDSHEEHGILFPMGAVAEIRIAEYALPVIRLDKDANS